MSTDIGPHLLGRYVNHDERSRRFAAPLVPAPTKSVYWRRYGPLLDQLNIGACTAFALSHCLNTTPLHVKGTRLRTADQARALYHDETMAEGQPWPPNDPGGSGLEVCKAAQAAGLIRSYEHVFGLDHAKGVIATTPFIMGINWYTEMFSPDPKGVITIGGKVEGGHEVEVNGYSPSRKMWRIPNSWGLDWGLKGVCYMHDDTLGRLLDEDGDCTVPKT